MSPSPWVTLVDEDQDKGSFSVIGNDPLSILTCYVLRISLIRSKNHDTTLFRRVFLLQTNIIHTHSIHIKRKQYYKTILPLKTGLFQISYVSRSDFDNLSGIPIGRDITISIHSYRSPNHGMQRHLPYETQRTFPREKQQFL